MRVTKQTPRKSHQVVHDNVKKNVEDEKEIPAVEQVTAQVEIVEDNRDPKEINSHVQVISILSACIFTTALSSVFKYIRFPNIVLSAVYIRSVFYMIAHRLISCVYIHYCSVFICWPIDFQNPFHHLYIFTHCSALCMLVRAFSSSSYQ